MDDLTLVCHLRMEGKFYILGKNDEIDKHTHVIFTLSDGRQLRYHDVRKFGRMELIEKGDYRIFKDLGPEPFWDEFNLDYVRKYFKDNHHPLKEVLLDQSFVAGIGNIYADEIAYLSKLHPLSRVYLLNDDDIMRIIDNTRMVLKKAISAGGTTIRSYTSSLGVSGRFQLELLCHTKYLCPLDHPIKKIRVGGRGTYYCPVCQKLKTRIAITGTIGAGKSTCSIYLRQLGYYVFDCDEENRRLLENNQAGDLLIRKYFPEVYVDDILDKTLLAKLVFSDKKKKEELESLLHPLIIKEMLKQAEEHDLFFAEVPLLFESKLEKYFDRSLLIGLDKDKTIDRLIERGMKREDALRRLSSQLPLEEKIKRADDFISNDKSLADLYDSIDIWLDSYVR